MNILCPGQKGGKGKAKIRGGFSLTTSKGPNHSKEFLDA